MRFTGFFQAESLSDEWTGYHRLATEMELRKLTNLQAQTILWYTRGLGPTAIGRLVNSSAGSLPFRIASNSVANKSRSSM